MTGAGAVRSGPLGDDRCNRPGCGGTVDATGFCERCLHRPLPPATSPSITPTGPAGRAGDSGGAAVPSAGSELHQGRGGAHEPTRSRVPSSAPVRTAWLVPELVSVPVPEPPDPSEQVLIDPQVPEPSRVCTHCRSSVGRPYAGRPAVLQGNCPHCDTPFSFVPKLRRGQLVADQYEVVGCVARGGLGWVYLAKDTHLDGNYVALKGLITNDEMALRLAVAERRFLTSIDHPNIVRIFNSVTHRDPVTGEETGYIVMEFLTGQSLQEIRAAAAL